MTERHHPTLNDILAKNIRIIRQKLKYSQEELAYKCGYHRTYIGSIERAERNITLNTLEAIAKALDVSAATLLIPQETEKVRKEKEGLYNATHSGE